jgi:DNA repair exonuclease SbcCD ATPase subunit
VALFHGTINGCTLQNYMKAPEGYPLEWFKGYDVAMLGDVHLQQVHNVDKDGNWNVNKLVWGYSGSLVQQNFGETIFDHGILVWDMQNKKVSSMNIFNPYGFVTLKETSNGLYYNYRKQWHKISQLLENPLCPKRMLLKVLTGEDVKYNEENLKTVLGFPYNISYNVVISSNSQDTVNVSDDGDDNEKHTLNDITSYNTPLNWMQYLEECVSQDKLNGIDWKKWITNPDSLLITDDMPSLLQERIKTKNDDIMMAIHNYHDSLDKCCNQRRTLSLVYMEWQWLLCFKENCYINFDNLSGSICTINAKNGYGKSSFLEVVCIALFGDPILSRYSKETSSSIICQQKPHGTRAKTCIIFQVNESKYHLQRVFDVQNADASKLVCSQCELSVIDEGNTANYLHSGKKAVDNWIKDNIGDIKSFLMSCMITQNCDQDFFNLKTDDQVELIESYLNLSSINSFSDVLRVSSNTYKNICDNMDDIMKWSKENIVEIDEDKYQKIKIQYNDTVEGRKRLEHEYDSITDKWHNVSDADMKLSNEAISRNIDDLENEVKSYNKDVTYDNMQQELGVLTSKINNLSKTIQTEKLYTSYTEEQLQIVKATLEEEFQSINDKISKCPQQPPRPNKEITCYEDWYAIYEEYKSSIIQRYGSIDNLLDQNTVENIVKPSVTEESLNKQKEIFDSEISNIRDYKLYVSNPDILEKNSRNAILEIKSLSLTKEHIADKLQDNQRILSDKRKILETYSSKLKVHMKNAIVKPTETMSDYDEFVETFEYYDNEIDSVRRKKDKCITIIKGVNSIDDRVTYIQKEIDTKQESINEILKANHPYNDECWACKQQVWKKHLGDLQKSVNDNKKTLDVLREKKTVLLGKRSLQKYEEIHNELIIFEKDYDEMKNDYIYWQKINEEWQKYIPYIKTLEEYEDIEDNLKKEVTTIQDVIDVLNAEMDEVTLKLKEKNDEKTILDYCNTNMSRWMYTEAFIQEQEINWEEYKTYSSTIDDLNRIQKLEDEKQAWHLYNIWDSNMKELEERKSSVDYNLKQVELCVLENERKNILETLYEYDIFVSKTKELDYWKEVLIYKADYEKKLNIKQELESTREKEVKLASQYQETKVLHAHYLAYLEENQRLKQCKETLLSIKNGIDHIHNKMSGFRKYLYKHKVMPRLLSETNKIVSLVTNADDLKLEVDIETNDHKQTNKPKTSLSWYFRNGVNRPPIEKASGFQRYMFGIAFRIAMASFGASSVFCSQMFIDEGFVACDSSHLSRVPDFLHGLLDIYSTIILVSHLDEIKDCASITIPIKRKDYLSCISYGQKYEVIKKKRVVKK